MPNFRDIFEDPLDIFGGRAQTQASEIETLLNNEGLDLQRELFRLLLGDQAPVLDARNQALGLLQGLDDGSFDPFLDPSLSFQREEGLRDIRNRAAASGKFNSGQRYIDEQNFEGGLRSDAINQAVSRILNLAGFSTQDVSTTNPILGSNIGAQGGLLQNQGRINANSIIGQANARNRGLNTGAGILGYYSPQIAQRFGFNGLG